MAMKIIGPEEFDDANSGSERMKDEIEVVSLDGDELTGEAKAQALKDLLLAITGQMSGIMAQKKKNPVDMSPSEFAMTTFQSNAAQLYKAQLKKEEEYNDSPGRSMWLRSLFPASVGCIAGVVGYIRSSKHKDAIIEEIRGLTIANKEDNDHPMGVLSMHETFGALILQWCTCDKEDLPQDLLIIENGVEEVKELMDK